MCSAQRSTVSGAFLELPSLSSKIEYTNCLAPRSFMQIQSLQLILPLRNSESMSVEIFLSLKALASLLVQSVHDLYQAARTANIQGKSKHDAFKNSCRACDRVYIPFAAEKDPNHSRWSWRSRSDYSLQSPQDLEKL